MQEARRKPDTSVPALCGWCALGRNGANEAESVLKFGSLVRNADFEPPPFQCLWLSSIRGFEYVDEITTRSKRWQCGGITPMSSGHLHSHCSLYVPRVFSCTDQNDDLSSCQTAVVRSLLTWVKVDSSSCCLKAANQTISFEQGCCFLVVLEPEITVCFLSNWTSVALHKRKSTLTFRSPTSLPSKVWTSCP